MTIQLQKTAAETIIMPTTNRVTKSSKGIGYARSSLEVLSCHTCMVKGNCLAEKLIARHDFSTGMVKNKRTVIRGQHVFRSGDHARAIYFVSRGTIKDYVLMENGEEQVLGFYQAGDIFSLDSMGSQCHVTSTLALEDTTICQLTLSDLQSRALGQSFLDLISDNLLREHNMMMMLARKDANGRMASFLLDMLKRVEKTGKSEDTITLTMTRQDIANYLGLAIETVSRTLRRFQDSGMLEVTRRTIRIQNFSRLLAIAGTQVSR